MVKFLETLTETFTIKNPKTLKLNGNKLCQREFFLIMTYFKSIKMSWRNLFTDNIFRNVE